MQNQYINQKNKGFTLIEMLVSVALFSVVLTVSLGTILTIADSNKKSRSLMSVTNNLNFAVDSMVRSFKTGDIGALDSGDTVTYNNGGTNNCFRTKEIDYAKKTGLFEVRAVNYCFVDVDGIGRIDKNGTQLTSPDVDIDYVEFSAAGTTSLQQPILTIIMAGTVKVSPTISSSFSIQTSVSQRKLNI